MPSHPVLDIEINVSDVSDSEKNENVNSEVRYLDEALFSCFHIALFSPLMAQVVLPR